MPTVKPTPKPVYRQTTLRDVVRRAEGPDKYPHRNTYVAYEFGGGPGRPVRRFLDQA
jgi:hypothetical protein